MPKCEAVLTVSALARLHGLDRRTVERRLTGVKPARTRRVGDRVFRYYRAADIRSCFEGGSVAEAWEELLGYRADLLEIRRSIRRRENIPVAEAQATVAAKIANAKQNLLVLPGKLADQLAGQNAASQRVLIDRALEEIAQELAGPLPWEKQR